MKRIPIVASGLLGALLLWSQAAPGGGSAGLTGTDVLRKMDAVMNAPRDQEMTAVMILTDRGGIRKERTLQIFQKGTDRRLARFLSPADQKGIGVLTQPDGSIYLYLPAYRKVRRIAGHVRNSSFAGTDFSYSDMEARRYAEDYDARLLEAGKDRFLLELTPRPAAESEYLRLRMEVKADNFFPLSIEFHDANGPAKRLSFHGIERQGTYWYSREMVMDDLHSGHQTRMTMREIRFDTGLADAFFSQRTLER